MSTASCISYEIVHFISCCYMLIICTQNINEGSVAVCYFAGVQIQCFTCSIVITICMDCDILVTS